MPVNFDPTIKLSDVLTSLSFLLAVVALISTLQKDRASAERERIAEARGLLSTSLTKLERLRELSDSIFDDVQPVVIQTTEAWAKDGDIIAARDFLWRELSGIYSTAKKRIVDEKISVEYIDLYRLGPELPDQYRRALANVADASEQIQGALLQGTQDAVLSFESERGPRITAAMGNKLREAIGTSRKDFEDRFERMTGPIHQRILASLAKSDADLWQEMRQGK